MSFVSAQSKFIKRLTVLLLSFSAIVVISSVIILPATVFGVTDVTIRGNVYKVPAPGTALVPLVNQQIKVLCGGVTKTVSTNSNGLYTVVFSEAGCTPFSFASAESKFNNSTINRQVQISSESRATINLFY